MPDGLPPELDVALPDEAHEALRLAVKAAVDDLAAQVQRISDAFLLLVSTADFAQSTLNTTIAGQGAIGQVQTKVVELGSLLSAVNTRAEAAAINARTALADSDLLQQQLAALTARVAALEPAPTPDLPGGLL
jgi:hypothetical protein